MDEAILSRRLRVRRRRWEGGERFDGSGGRVGLGRARGARAGLVGRRLRYPRGRRDPHLMASPVLNLHLHLDLSSSESTSSERVRRCRASASCRRSRPRRTPPRRGAARPTDAAWSPCRRSMLHFSCAADWRSARASVALRGPSRVSPRPAGNRKTPRANRADRFAIRSSPRARLLPRDRVREFGWVRAPVISL